MLFHTLAHSTWVFFSVEAVLFPTLLSPVSHHSAVGTGPLSSPHHPERAISEPLKQLQLRLSDQAGERGGSLATGCDNAGRSPLRQGLLGVAVGSFNWEHLRAQKQKLVTVVFPPFSFFLFDLIYRAGHTNPRDKMFMWKHSKRQTNTSDKIQQYYLKTKATQYISSSF